MIGRSPPTFNYSVQLFFNYLASKDCKVNYVYYNFEVSREDLLKFSSHINRRMKLMITKCEIKKGDYRNIMKSCPCLDLQIESLHWKLKLFLFDKICFISLTDVLYLLHPMSLFLSSEFMSILLVCHPSLLVISARVFVNFIIHFHSIFVVSVLDV